MSAVLCLNTTSANWILYKSSVIKKLILCYILNTILGVFANKNVTYKATAELLRISEQHSDV